MKYENKPMGHDISEPTVYKSKNRKECGSTIYGGRGTDKPVQLDVQDVCEEQYEKKTGDYVSQYIFEYLR